MPAFQRPRFAYYYFHISEKGEIETRRCLLSCATWVAYAVMGNSYKQWKSFLYQAGRIRVIFTMQYWSESRCCGAPLVLPTSYASECNCVVSSEKSRLRTHTYVTFSGGSGCALTSCFWVSQLGGVFRREFGGTEVVYYTYAPIPQLLGTSWNPISLSLSLTQTGMGVHA